MFDDVFTRVDGVVRNGKPVYQTAGGEATGGNRTPIPRGLVPLPR